MITKFRIASLFAGIGGICDAFKQAGAEIVWANEIDKNACITYRHNLGSDYLHEADIKCINSELIPEFDILTAGFPCQAFSVAGHKQGFRDDRGHVFFEIIRILRDKKPKAFFLENVKNLISHDKGNTFNIICNELKGLGYFIDFSVLNSMEYGNLPQNRERIYIIGFLDEDNLKNFNFPDKVTLTKTIHDIINTHDKKPDCFYYTKTKYYEELKSNMINKNTVYQWRRKYVRENKNNVCPTLTANMGTGGHNVPLIIDDFDIRKLTPEECLGFQGFNHEFSFPCGISRSSCYKQAGNSVSVPVVKRIAENLIRAMMKTTKG